MDPRRHHRGAKDAPGQPAAGKLLAAELRYKSPMINRQLTWLKEDAVKGFFKKLLKCLA
jgi:hypothetical protein